MKPELKREEFSVTQVLMLLYHVSKQTNQEGYFSLNLESAEGKLVAEEKEISGKKMVKIDRRELLQLAKEELGKQENILRH